MSTTVGATQSTQDDPIRPIADALLYEGYLLWPYRRSALKNRKRWTFGGVFPESYSRARGEDDPWWVRTECLVEGDGATRVEVEVRFLHLVHRDVLDPETGDSVDEITVGDARYVAFEEATERRAASPSLRLDELFEPRRVAIEVPAGRALESLQRHDGTTAGVLRRSWRAVSGELELQAEPRGEDLFLVSAQVTNTTFWAGVDREEAVERAFISTHTVLGVAGGRFVSLLDPPPRFAKAAEVCRNVRTWPVLVGEEGDRSRVLSSPIILYDYPRVAPESPADLFDATEIDELLTLSILALTDEEKSEMRATDPRARALLERASSMTADDFRRLHGTMRDARVLGRERGR